MPTLQELKDKWFIDEGTEPDLVYRHDGTNVSDSTDNNLVTILGEGNVYMGEWNHQLAEAASWMYSEIYNVNWGIDNVETIANTPGTEALDALIYAHDQNVTVYQLSCNNPMSLLRNVPSNTKLEIAGIPAMRDQRFPPNGSNHQKLMVAKYASNAVGLIGSIDINEGRFDTIDHNGFGFTHDFGVKVEGPAVADMEWTFLERWNDSSRGWPNTLSLGPVPGPITENVGSYTSSGSHSVQVLRTYGINTGVGAYSWSDKGEFSIWMSTLNAIKRAQSYIYIEDQTFFTFNWPPCCDQNPNPKAQATDLVFQLGEALRDPNRNVKVGIMVSNKTKYGVYLNGYEKFQRDYSLRYLQNIANQNNPNNFFVGYLHNGTDIIYIHSKMFIVDDEFALIGSANMDQRSMTHDSEIKIGVVDEGNEFVKDLRLRLYTEHLGRSEAELNDPTTAFDRFRDDVHANNHRVRAYDFYSSVEWKKHAEFMNTIWSPYAGPSNLR